MTDRTETPATGGTAAGADQIKTSEGRDLITAQVQNHEPTSLQEIVAAIKTLEKNTLRDAVRIGELLYRAEQQLKHGEFMPWLKREFAGWSHDTSLNYRNVYHLSRNPKFSDFDPTTCNLSLSVVYLIAKFAASKNPPLAKCKKLLQADKSGQRISHQQARDSFLGVKKSKPKSRPKAEVDDDLPERRSRLATAITVLQDANSDDPEWREIINHNGVDAIQRIMTMLEMVISKHNVEQQKEADAEVFATAEAD